MNKTLTVFLLYSSLMMSANIQAFGNEQYSQTRDRAHCPRIFNQGTIDLSFNPAFMHVDKYNDGEGLTISSFFNIAFDPSNGDISFFERDLVARIPQINQINADTFNESADLEILTDLDGEVPSKTVWPNDVKRVPDGVLPFEALMVPQGFHPALFPGRLSLINLDDPSLTEYLIHQSTQGLGGFTFPGDPNNTPAYYHQVVYIDMDNDGLKDIVTVRSSFRVVPSIYPPFGELVWFKNPGDNLDAATPWEETVLFGGRAAGFAGPDIKIDSYDFEGDGIPEIIATHFFTGDAENTPPMQGKISIYGAPVNGTWADVNSSIFMLPRRHDISTDQGFPFSVEIVDLNRDGRMDILATNHQPDNCSPRTSSEVPGRVYALEIPASDDLFNDTWPVHILQDNIRPQPSLPSNPRSRLAPGNPSVFYPYRFLESVGYKPSIVVGGDQAGKVWVLSPKSRKNKNDWNYRSAVIFDINDFYGPNTTQTPLGDPFGVANSTIGGVAVGYKGQGPFAAAQIYVPAFEGKQVHIFSYRRQSPGDKRIQCLADVTLQCPIQ